MSRTGLSEYLFNLGVDLAREQAPPRAADFAPSVVVTGTVLGPSGVRVACGQDSFPRCQADVFDDAGTLTITSVDDDAIVREYVAGQWVEATVFNAGGHIAYSLFPRTRRGAS